MKYLFILFVASVCWAQDYKSSLADQERDYQAHEKEKKQRQTERQQGINEFLNFKDNLEKQHTKALHEYLDQKQNQRNLAASDEDEDNRIRAAVKKQQQKDQQNYVDEMRRREELKPLVLKNSSGNRLPGAE